MRCNYLFLFLAVLGATAVFAAPANHPQSSWGRGGVSAGAPQQAGGASVTAPGQDNSGSGSSSPGNVKRSMGKCPPGKFLCAHDPIKCCEVGLPNPPPPTHPYRGPGFLIHGDIDFVARGIDIDDPLTEITDKIEEGVEDIEETVSETKEDIEDIDIDIDSNTKSKPSVRRGRGRM
ncbi:hypothetical protein LTR70_000743 [Exophiala xenobiotica]|uniref:Uncharacterized protein n=1 Tax=Lithohypha guttulata TaxID=1690604 RepID=A0ABR0KNA4_9EURO|nr:hypothetical protein LTR24_000585 [Lithohypha guttulata]KAK5329246.1 hypothetical protein LTR70_000743 [Exophiala xenobiotica]